ncbi:MAG: OB-fold domain-containing protein [Acidimicrobiia bacterium]|nr:OB-fold domain-containing protein [Acidimicrobiia bacterium]
MRKKRIPLEDGYFRMPDSADDAPRLLGSYSPAADRCFWPRRKLCPITSEPVEDRLLSPEGLLYSWTFIEMPWMGSMKTAESGGYGVGQIDLPEGVRVQALIDGQQGDWTIGMRMVFAPRTVSKDEDGNELCTVAFAPAAGKTDES